MKVLFSTNVPSPYRVNFFNELGKECDLTVLFEKGTSSERDKSWMDYKFENFAGIIMKGFSIKPDSALCLGFKKYIKKIKPDIIVICNFASPTGVLLARYCRKNNLKYYIESDGGFGVTKQKGFKYKIKKKIFENSIGCFSTSKTHDKYYLSQGAKEKQIIRYHFTSIYENYIVEKKSTNNDSALKMLFVGQFIHRKGIDVFLKAIGIIHETNFTVNFIGGNPNDEYNKLVEENALEERVNFDGFKNSLEVRQYMMDADVMVLPTREDIWGLVINEAMACGCVVVTTNKCVAGLELIENGINGYLFESENVNELANIINNLIKDRNHNFIMSNNNLKKIKMYTFEQMVKDHMEVFKKEVKPCQK